MENIKIEKFLGSIEAHSRIRREVISLVKENSESISMFVYDRNSKLCNYLSEREGIRAAMLLDNIGRSDANRKYLILAKENVTGRFLGFAILSPELENTGKISITMTAVINEFRKRGVFRAIIAHIKENYAGISLTCSPRLVPMYEKLGLHVDGYYQTHICMKSDNTSGAGTLISIDDKHIIRHPSVIAKYNDLVSKAGKKVVDMYISQWQEDFAKGEISAKTFYEQYITNTVAL